MQNYKKIIAVLLFIGIASAQTDADLNSIYQTANDAMLNEDFSSAIDLYESILDQSKEHPDLYYNLGSAYYRTDKIGQAIWAFEKGLQLSPRDKDLKFNLELANTRVRDRIEMPETILILEQYRALKKSATLMDVLLVAASILMVAALVYFLKKYNQWRSIWLTRLIISLFLLSLAVHLVALDKYYELSNKSEMIIVESEVSIFSAPFDRKESTIFRLHEGVKAEITQDQQDWLEIELIDGKKGWIQSEKVRKL